MKKTAKIQTKAKLQEVSREAPARKKFTVMMEVEGDMLDKDTPIGEESIAALFQLQYQSEKVLKILRIDVKPKRAEPIPEILPDFTISKIIKFDSRPARFKVVIRKKGEDKDHEVGPIENAVMTDIREFRKAFFETGNTFIANLNQRNWETLIYAAPVEIRKASEV